DVAGAALAHELADGLATDLLRLELRHLAPEGLTVDVHDLVAVELLAPRHALRQLLGQDLVPHRALAERMRIARVRPQLRVRHLLPPMRAGRQSDVTGDPPRSTWAH